MRRVLVRSVHDAFEYVMQHYYPAGLKEFAERTDSYAVISIQDSHTSGFGIQFCENAFCKGALTLLFDDVYDETSGAVCFTEEMAVQIIDFILGHKDVETLLIHCYAGQSRSLAVGAFALRMSGGDNRKYFEKHSPNQMVYDTLCRVYEEKYQHLLSGK